ncbi:hypothetical protein L596_011634 [Steinernema carpocapsae]|uniref:J domain-containing protein n=1 Tax=Steinernema carpocapsae TaxID=34508 RepID=A0A4U5NVA8_STECR|nr:hypothetical protein L596_011634 [Steinernema carpocapsae]
MTVCPRRCFSLSSALRRTYYDVLGVEKTATPNEIKKAFYALSKKYHPDQANPEDSTSSAKFHQLTDAYDVLKDGEKRRVYDDEISAGLHTSYDYGRSYAEKRGDPENDMATNASQRRPNIKDFHFSRNGQYSKLFERRGNFYDPNEEFEREDQQKRFIRQICLILGGLVALNGVYIWFQSAKRKELNSSRPAPLPSSSIAD